MRGTALRNDGIYSWPGLPGREWVSVTRIIDETMSQSRAFAFAAWSASHAAELARHIECGEPYERAERRIDPTTGAIEWLGVPYDPLGLLQDGKYMRGEPLRQAEKAKDRGSCCHDFLSEWAGGLRLTDGDVAHWVEHDVVENERRCGDEPVPYVQSLNRWLAENEPRVIATEFPVFHDGLGYAGTADGVWEAGGRTYLVDLKTTKATDLPHAVQLAAYYSAPLWGDMARGRRVRAPRLHAAGVLLCQPDKCTFRAWDDMDRHFATFRHALALYRAMHGGSRARTMRFEEAAA